MRWAGRNDALASRIDGPVRMAELEAYSDDVMADLLLDDGRGAGTDVLLP